MHKGQFQHHRDRSKLRLQILSGGIWLAGAGVGAAWMLHGGGVVRPAATFAVWAAGVLLLTIRGLDRTTETSPTLGEAARALTYGGYSAALLTLCTLFIEFWPVTVTMIFLFAICRSFKSEDTPAYG